MESKKLVIAAVLIVFIIAALAFPVSSASAQEPARQMTILVSYIEYEWWLISWDHNQVVCEVFIDHENLPTVADVANNCGEKLAIAWLFTPPCKDLLSCRGLYVHLVSYEQKEREVVIELPRAVVWVSLEGCTPIPPENLCPSIPALVLSGEEPLPDERILAIHGTYDGVPFSCLDQLCTIPLLSSSMLGSTIEFWAESSYGDVSERFVAHVRVVDTGFSSSLGTNGWYVDVISTQWQGMPLASCMRIWEAFPPIGGPPNWLATPDSPDSLASDDPYYYLAGRLISQGIADGSSCATGGLLPNGYADACGLENARPIVEAWQNQFDMRIIDVARETGIPAQLMKNLFAQESQFWPGLFRVPFEYGLGQLTENGADPVLLWNEAFYEQFCPLVLSTDACEGGYLNLGDNEQAILRGALALQAKSDCSSCPTGVNLSNVNFTVLLFANTLQANCAQVSRTIYTATNMMAGRVSTYEDLWRFTVANYHSGPGCVSFAIHQAWDNDASGQITWDVAKDFFTEPCKGVIPYVEKITR